MANHNQCIYHDQATSHKSSSCICCSCNDEERELETSKSNCAIRCRCWDSNSPPQPPDAWSETFDQLLRQWTNHEQKNGQEDHAQPYYPTPGDVRMMFGQSDINGAPEYATGHTLRDPEEWKPAANQAPSINQQVEEWARWERATLHVSVKSFDPVTGSHFSMGSTWNPGATPVVNSITRNPVSSGSINQNRSPMERSQSSAMDNSSIPPHLHETLTTQGQPSGQLYSTTHMKQPSKYNNFDIQEQSPSQMYRSQRDIKGDFSKTPNTGNAEFVRCMRDKISKARFKPSHSQMERSQMSAMDNSNIPPHLHESLTTQGQTSGQLYSTTHMKQPSNYSNLDIQEQSPSQMYGSQRDLKGDFSKTTYTGNAESVRSTRDEMAKPRFQPSHSQMESSQMLAMDNSNIPPHLHESLTTQGHTSGQLYSTTHMKQPSKYSNLDIQEQSPSQMYRSQRDIKGDFSKTPNTGNAEFVRCMRDKISKARFKPSHSQMDNASIPPHVLESVSSRDKLSGEQYSSSNMNQITNEKILEVQGQSASQMSKKDMRDDVSNTTFGGIMESFRSIRDHVSKVYLKPSQSQVKSQNNHNYQGQSTSQRDFKQDVSKTTYKGNIGSLQSIREQESEASLNPSRSQNNRGEIVESNTSSVISQYVPIDEIHSSASFTSAEQIVDLEAQEQALPKKSLLCSKCNYIQSCGCVKLENN